MDYHQYINSPAWINRAKALKEKIGKCQLCSDTTLLQVHHNSYEHLGNEPDEDLIVLCAICHNFFHRSKAMADTVFERIIFDLFQYTHPDTIKLFMQNEFMSKKLQHQILKLVLTKD